MKSAFLAGVLAVSVASLGLNAQSLGSAGTVEGTVTDPSGAIVANAAAEIGNPITGYTRKATSSTT
ncbi:MAG: hypothetical protein ABIZ80_04410, partial [Bryobacteraceae bacterium]